MSKTKPGLPKGTRDFGPELMLKRNFILNRIREVFENYGYQPLETPSLERLDVLTGKYGQEGDQLIFKILNSGDFLKDIRAEDLEQGYKKLTSRISEKALRYDLTVPFARFVTMNRGKINFPFKRYQIQPVWRGDRPQKGRYREFYQCDADVVGTNSLICEAEIILMINEVMTKLGINGFFLKMNNRKILNGIAEWLGAPDQLNQLCVALDKLDKIGQAKVLLELQERGFEEAALKNLEPILAISGNFQESLDQIEAKIGNTSSGAAGIAEVRQVLKYLTQFSGRDINSIYEDFHLEMDITLARGLDYYTGAIFEVKAADVSIGSISGGGRYDDLTGSFGMPDMSGVGFSFGLDRIYDVMEELQLFPEDAQRGTQVLFSNFDAESEAFALPVLNRLRQVGIASEIFPHDAKLKKQLNYANARNIPYVILIGKEEMEENKLSLKNMSSGEQSRYSPEELIEFLKKTLF